MVRNQFTESIKRQAINWFWGNYTAVPMEHQSIFDMGSSVDAYEQSVSGIGMGELAEVEEGEEFENDNAAEGFTVYAKMRKFGKRTEVTQELVEDNRQVKSFLKSIVGGWGSATNMTMERFFSKFFVYGGLTAGHDVFNNTITGVLTDSTGDLCYDSKPLFNLSNNTRTSKGGGTYYNGIASDLDADNFETLWNLVTVTNAKNERDEEIVIMPNMLVVPPQLRFTAQRLLESENKPGELINDINTLQDIVTLKVWRYLAGDSDAWFLGVAGKGLKGYRRRPPKVDFYYDEDREVYKAKTSTRFGGTVDDFRPWGGSNFSTT